MRQPYHIIVYHRIFGKEIDNPAKMVYNETEVLDVLQVKARMKDEKTFGVMLGSYHLSLRF